MKMIQQRHPEGTQRLSMCGVQKCRNFYNQYIEFDWVNVLDEFKKKIEVLHELKSHLFQYVVFP